MESSSNVQQATKLQDIVPTVNVARNYESRSISSMVIDLNEEYMPDMENYSGNCEVLNGTNKATNFTATSHINITEGMLIHIHFQLYEFFLKKINHNFVYFITGYSDIGDPIHICTHCDALFWYNERQDKHYKAKNPKYTGCCSSGKIKLPKLQDPPQVLQDLFYGHHPNSKHFQENVRSFNNMFCFTSMGGKIEYSINQGGSPPIFKLSGQNYHQIGSLLPNEGQTPKFAQMYIFDTHNEINNRIRSVRYFLIYNI